MEERRGEGRRRKGEEATYAACGGEMESKGVELGIIDPEGREECSQTSLQGGERV